MHKEHELGPQESRIDMSFRDIGIDIVNKSPFPLAKSTFVYRSSSLSLKSTLKTLDMLP